MAMARRDGLVGGMPARQCVLRVDRDEGLQLAFVAFVRSRRSSRASAEVSAAGAISGASSWTGRKSRSCGGSMVVSIE